MTTNHLTESDSKAVASYLRDAGYADLEEWARDGGYHDNEISSEWYGPDDFGPWASPVDLEVECFREYERQGELQDEARYG